MDVSSLWGQSSTRHSTLPGQPAFAGFMGLGVFARFPVLGPGQILERMLLLSAVLLLRLAGQWAELLSAALCVALASLRRL